MQKKIFKNLKILNCFTVKVTITFAKTPVDTVNVPL